VTLLHKSAWSAVGCTDNVLRHMSQNMNRCQELRVMPINSPEPVPNKTRPKIRPGPAGHRQQLVTYVHGRLKPDPAMESYMRNFNSS